MNILLKKFTYFSIITSIFIIFVAIKAPSFILYPYPFQDFTNYYTASYLYLDDRVSILFGLHMPYLEAMREIFHPEFPDHGWSYPPHFVLLLIPLALMPYSLALFVFLTATCLLFITAVKALARDDQHRWFNVMFCFALVSTVFYTQNGLYTSALLIAAIALRDKNPVLAGIAAGFLTMKPHLGLLLPILFLFERRFVTIGIAIITASALVALSCALFGWESWTNYFTITMEYQTQSVMREGTGIFRTMMPSVFATVFLWTGAFNASLFVHFAFAIIVFLAFLVTIRRLDTRERGFSLVFATFLILPYSFCYDLPALTAVCCLLMMEMKDRHPMLANVLLPLTASLPLTTQIFGVAHMPIAPLIIAATWALYLNAKLRMPAPDSNKPVEHDI